VPCHCVGSDPAARTTTTSRTSTERATTGSLSQVDAAGRASRGHGIIINHQLQRCRRGSTAVQRVNKNDEAKEDARTYRCNGPTARSTTRRRRHCCCRTSSTVATVPSRRARALDPLRLPLAQDVSFSDSCQVCFSFCFWRRVQTAAHISFRLSLHRIIGWHATPVGPRHSFSAMC
jgi:hypothetical protein